MDATKKINNFQDNQRKLWEALEQPHRMYEINNVASYARALFSFCQLQPGDIAVLVNVPVISETESWGYLGAKHLFVIGANVEIVSLDYCEKQFVVGFMFKHETWIDLLTLEEKLVSDRSVYSLPANKFRKSA